MDIDLAEGEEDFSFSLTPPSSDNEMDNVILTSTLGSSVLLEIVVPHPSFCSCYNGGTLVVAS